MGPPPEAARRLVPRHRQSIVIPFRPGTTRTLLVLAIRCSDGTVLLTGMSCVGKSTVLAALIGAATARSTPTTTAGVPRRPVGRAEDERSSGHPTRWALAPLWRQATPPGP